jgi:hypothetical protein
MPPRNRKQKTNKTPAIQPAGDGNDGSDTTASGSGNAQQATAQAPQSSAVGMLGSLAIGTLKVAWMPVSFAGRVLFKKRKRLVYSPAQAEKILNDPRNVVDRERLENAQRDRDKLCIKLVKLNAKITKTTAKIGVLEKNIAAYEKKIKERSETIGVQEQEETGMSISFGMSLVAVSAMTGVVVGMYPAQTAAVTKDVVVAVSGMIVRKLWA